MDKIIQDPEKEMNSRTVQKLSAINYIFEYNLTPMQIAVVSYRHISTACGP